MIYKLLQRVIANGGYDVSDIQNKLDVYLMFNRISTAQYEELAGLITPAE